MPNPNGYGPMVANTPITGPTWQPVQQQYMQQPQFIQPPPVQNYQNAPVMSIAPVSGRDNAMQFPVGVGTELWLVDKAARKIYIKNNSANPREMQEIDFTYVVNRQNQNDSVSRAEFEDMKNMMAQMMSMMQSSQQPQQEQSQRRQKSDWKRGNRNDQSDGSSANNG